MKLMTVIRHDLVKGLVGAVIGATWCVHSQAQGSNMTPDQLSKYMDPYVAEINKILPRMQGDALRQEKVVTRPGGVLVMNYTALYPVSPEMLAYIDSHGRADAVRSLCRSVKVRSLLEAGAIIRYSLHGLAGDRLLSIDVKRNHCW